MVRKRRAARRAVAVAIGLVVSGLAAPSQADTTLPGDPDTIGDVQVVIDLTVPTSPAPPEGSTCTLTAEPPVVERDPSSGSFREAGTGRSECESGIRMVLAAELHYYTAPSGVAGQLVGDRDTRAGWGSLSAKGTWRPNRVGYVRTISQVRLTFPKPVSDYKLSGGCARTGTNTAVCNAASRAVAVGPALVGG